MKIYIAGEAYGSRVFPAVDFKFNRLETFWRVFNKQQVEPNIGKYNDFLLDSGAFTFMMAKKNGKEIKIDLDYFTDAYIDYINAMKIEKFFEMDVDNVLGYKKVLQLRSRIESKTGRQSIPVFHMSRGKDEYIAHCKDYGYIAIGIAGKDVAWGNHEAFKAFVLKAQEYGTKVHGLGITGMKSLERVPFYSVDSSAWTAGNRYKGMCFFDGKRIVNAKNLENKRIINHEGLALHNLNQWIRFAEYASNKIIL